MQMYLQRVEYRVKDAKRKGIAGYMSEPFTFFFWHGFKKKDLCSIYTNKSEGQRIMKQMRKKIKGVDKVKDGTVYIYF